MEGNLSRNTILLAVEFFQEDAESAMSFYCEIPEVKSGFMFINLGYDQPKNAFWNGLLLTLNRLKNYHNRTLELAICPSYMTLFSGGKGQIETMKCLNQFSEYRIVDYNPFFDRLEKVFAQGIINASPKGVLIGYTLEQFSNITNDIVMQMKQKVKEKRFYTDLTMPKKGIVLDFESTSYIAKFGRIIEISALKFAEGRIIDEYQTLVDPVIKIPKASRELTGITQQDVAGAPKSIDAMKKLASYIRDCEVLVGHNIAFDYKFVESFLKRFHLPTWKGKLLCTMKLAKSLTLGVKNHKLETLCDLFCVSNERPHRAWSDTRATFEVMKHLYNDSLLN